ncbi:MAG TPA: hypothetical protein VFU98_04890 [Microlunatus sp.]|nr:hypothetical protein [Microlunatus sp.]
MTESAGTPIGGPDRVRPPVGKVVAAVVRAVASTAVLVAIYYVLPLEESPRRATIIVLGIVVLCGLVAVQVD